MNAHHLEGADLVSGENRGGEEEEKEQIIKVVLTASPISRYPISHYLTAARTFPRRS